MPANPTTEELTLSTEDLVDVDERAEQPAAVRTARTDGRKRRWRQHKIDRRSELVDGTLAAVRTRGSNAGMDEIAAHIGVSKTVLYRYFSDKNDLVNAAMQRFIELTLMPRVYGALSLDADEYQLVRSALSEYVAAVDEDPEVYRFIMGNGSGDPSSLADFEKLFAEVVAAAIVARAGDRGYETDGALLWSYVLVGGIQLATHWWTANKTMPRDEVIDHLTMMVWSSIEGMARAGGSRTKFAQQSHVLPEPVEDAPTD
ncbi:TetR/AcrR family transcriptional regulator [Nocardia donostiensis]|uniref:TetR/AcrR family transcriptional regulator n=1 Tax=Nocardia donostiensis TaxID=1538463 RepID=UPI001FE7FA87|nr:TetR/AcrR family transcriptional regulator [Nocardia donostiensis]